MSEGKAGSRIRMDYDSALPHLRRAAQERGGKLLQNEMRKWICEHYGVKDDGGPNLTNRLRRLTEFAVESGSFRLDGNGRKKYLVPLGADGSPETGAPLIIPAPSPVSGFQPPVTLPADVPHGGGDAIERLLREQAEFRKLLATLLQAIGPNSPMAWEYKLVNVRDNGAGAIDYSEDGGPVERMPAKAFSLTALFVRMGDQGWELIGMDPESYIFKRPKRS